MDAFRHTSMEPSIPFSTVSVMLKQASIEATLATYMRGNDQRVARMEQQIDRLAKRPRRPVDWATVIKLGMTLMLMAGAGAGILTWPQATQYSAVLNGKSLPTAR